MKSLLIVFVCVVSLFSHSGRTTDEYGGHNDNINGGYHYHNKPHKENCLSQYDNMIIMFRDLGYTIIQYSNGYKVINTSGNVMIITCDGIQ